MYLFADPQHPIWRMRSRITETGQHGQCAAYVFTSMVISASHNPTSKDQNHHFKCHVARIQRFFQKHVSELFGGLSEAAFTHLQMHLQERYGRIHKEQQSVE